MRTRLSLTLVICSVVVLVALSCGTDPESQGADAAADGGSDADSAADGDEDAMVDAGTDAMGSEDADAAADVSDGSHCSGLDEASCLADPTCSARFGVPLPSGTKRFASCRPQCVGGALHTCAIDPVGTCWLFPETCVPEGWTKVWECEPAECAWAADAGPW